MSDEHNKHDEQPAIPQQRTSPEPATADPTQGSQPKQKAKKPAGKPMPWKLTRDNDGDLVLNRPKLATGSPTREGRNMLTYIKEAEKDIKSLRDLRAKNAATIEGLNKTLVERDVKIEELNASIEQMRQEAQSTAVVLSEQNEQLRRERNAALREAKVYKRITLLRELMSRALKAPVSDAVHHHTYKTVETRFECGVLDVKLYDSEIAQNYLQVTTGRHGVYPIRPLVTYAFDKNGLPTRDVMIKIMLRAQAVTVEGRKELERRLGDLIDFYVREDELPCGHVPSVHRIEAQRLIAAGWPAEIIDDAFKAIEEEGAFAGHNMAFAKAILRKQGFSGAMLDQLAQRFPLTINLKDTIKPALPTRDKPSASQRLGEIALSSLGVYREESYRPNIEAERYPYPKSVGHQDISAGHGTLENLIEAYQPPMGLVGKFTKISPNESRDLPTHTMLCVSGTYDPLCNHPNHPKRLGDKS